MVREWLRLERTWDGPEYEEKPWIVELLAALRGALVVDKRDESAGAKQARRRSKIVSQARLASIGRH